MAAPPASASRMDTRPVFLVSLPRSGSTLLQKLLSANPAVASHAEPWVLLPFWGMREAGAARSVYSHHTAVRGLDEFIASLPDGEEVFTRAVGAFARSLYQAASGGRPVFLDKTPRYHLALPLLRRALPEAAVVVLLRNPLAVLASICQSFYRGRFLWHEYWVDWLDGHRCLAEAVREAPPNQFVVRYETLVQQPETTLSHLCRSLGLDYTPAMLGRYREQTCAGRLGDRWGVNSHAGVSEASVERWRAFFDTAFRRRVAESMLALIAEDDLAVLGYPRCALREALHATPARPGWDARSRLDHLMGGVAQAVDFRLLQARWRARRTGAPWAMGWHRGPASRGPRR